MFHAIVIQVTRVPAGTGDPSPGPGSAEGAQRPPGTAAVGSSGGQGGFWPGVLGIQWKIIYILFSLHQRSSSRSWLGDGGQLGGHR